MSSPESFSVATETKNASTPLQPDHQGEHDVDHQALVEEPERPEWRVLHSRDSRQRQQNGEHARDGERADGEPGPSDELAPDGALKAGGGPPEVQGGRCRLRRFAH